MKKLPLFFILLLPTFLISRNLFIGYFCADNNMYNGFLKNYDQMVQISKELKNTDIIIFLDSYTLSYTLKIYEGKSETLKVSENTNSGDFKNISNFFSNFYRFDYDLRIMVLWDHGNGWYNFTTKNKSIFFDNHPFDFISVTEGELKNIFVDIYKKTGKKTDLLVFDACLMQCLEVSYELKDYVSYIVGSEGIVPYNGFPYDRILTVVDTLSDPEKISEGIVEKYYDFYFDSSYSDLTLSSIKTSNLVNDLKNLKILKRDDFFFIDDVDVSCDFKNSLVLNRTKNEKYRGIKLFFPKDFSTFKTLYKDYINLSLDKDFGIIKKEFLSYNIQDTFSPLPVKNISLAQIGENDFEIFFESSYDFSPIKEYQITHSNSFTLYNENCDSIPDNFSGDLHLWDSTSYSKPYSLFSKNFSFEIFLPQKENIISFYYKGLFGDSSFKIYLNGEVLKVLDGEITNWKRFVLKADSGYLKIVFNENLNRDYFIYLDDLKIYKLQKHYKTFLYQNYGKIHKIGDGQNVLFVEAKDIYGNVSAIDTIIEFFVKDTVKSYSYPNPARNIVNLFSGYKGFYNIFIYTSDGKKIFEKSGIKNDDQIVINIENFKSGLYFYILDIDGKKMKGKFFVER
ncbi:MAG: clostripain-related cysteine peptidase [bacterium]|nr:clostripain-related cysteine peptidase [bacterium]